MPNDDHITLSWITAAVSTLSETLAQETEFEAAGLTTRAKLILRRGGPDLATYEDANAVLHEAQRACIHESSKHLFAEVLQRTAQRLADLMEEKAGHEYAFDVKLHTVIRVQAASMEEAEAMLRDAFYSADANFGAWPNGDPILAACSMEDAIDLLEIDGEAV
jgi:hypothetical protein